jgi:hypothetical protein
MKVDLGELENGKRVKTKIEERLGFVNWLKSNRGFFPLENGKYFLLCFFKNWRNGTHPEKWRRE